MRPAGEIAASRASVAIIPAYNEARTVAGVVRVARASGVVTRVLVVDDGSVDQTADVARAVGAEVLTLRPNRGKGGAMRAGLEASSEPVVLFLDADLVGFTPAHVRALIEPVAAGDAGMAVGLRDYGGTYNALQAAIPPITGERAVRRALLARVPAAFWSGFRIEVAINEVVARAGEAIARVPLAGLTIVPKWAKVGVRAGIRDGARMMVEVLKAQAEVKSWPR